MQERPASRLDKKTAAAAESRGASLPATAWRRLLPQGRLFGADAHLWHKRNEPTPGGEKSEATAPRAAGMATQASQDSRRPPKGSLGNKRGRHTIRATAGRR
ncbi:hypothetical protein AAFF_G00335610 [Aldrovandia affinis]|uniref:Uncharacterized protein n=1 Tax=Aldrovandia affinis TaxID=143900 RepID=A0AAD7WPY6_9TELE|nr:hypothetical protein AAFF_G00335610 [Aldrovandia affinis]